MQNGFSKTSIRELEKKSGGYLRALALTAFAGEENRAKTRAAGFHEHLVKPVDLEEFLSTVSRLLALESKPRAAMRS